MNNRRGRPAKEDSRHNRIEVRLNADDVVMLNDICLETDKSKSEILRDALKIYYKSQVYRN